MTTALEKVRAELLTDGLADYVDLGAVDSQVTRHNPSAPISQVQRETLDDPLLGQRWPIRTRRSVRRRWQFSWLERVAG